MKPGAVQFVLMPICAHCCWRYSTIRSTTGIELSTTVNSKPFGYADLAMNCFAFVGLYVNAFATFAS